jgi:hypothetical protein
VRDVHDLHRSATPAPKSDDDVGDLFSRPIQEHLTRGLPPELPERKHKPDPDTRTLRTRFGKYERVLMALQHLTAMALYPDDVTAAIMGLIGVLEGSSDALTYKGVELGRRMGSRADSGWVWHPSKFHKSPRVPAPPAEKKPAGKSYSHGKPTKTAKLPPVKKAAPPKATIPTKPLSRGQQVLKKQAEKKKAARAEAKKTPAKGARR